MAVEAEPILALADAVESEADLSGQEMVPPSLATKIANLLAVILPLAGVVAAAMMTWEGLVGWVSLSLLLIGYVATAIGITVGYHRLFTHRSYEAVTPVKVFFGILGGMAVQGSIIQWSSTHRKHHQHTDREEDPHSPVLHGDGVVGTLKGIYHAHIGWMFAPGATRAEMDRYVPDLLADPVTRRVSDLFPLWVVLSAVLPTAIAWAITGTAYGALMGFVWGALVRVFVVHHVTWSINSVCHLWGSRPFDTHDESRNNVIFGVLAQGEGWHNNHHAFPASARHGLEWWQFDLSYWLIKGMEAVGLVKRVRVPDPARIEAKRVRAKAGRGVGSRGAH